MRPSYKRAGLLIIILGHSVWNCILPATAMMSADLDAAKALAENQCATCHVIPEISTTGAEAAPTFVLLANQKTTGSWEALATILKSPHWPENGSPLSGTDIDNLIGYILSFTEK